MVKYDSLFVFLVISIFLIMLLAAFIVKMKNKRQIHYVFLSNILFLFIWSLARLIQIFVQNNFEYVVLLEHISYIGVCLVPVSLFYTGIIFAKNKVVFSKKHILLFIIPIISLIMAFTNSYHNLFIVKYSFDSLGFVYGKYYIIHELYSYILITIGLYYLIYFSIRNSGFFSKQSLLIFFGILGPVVVVVLSTQKIIEMPVFIENISFSFAIIFFAIAIFKFDFLNVVPVALQRIVDLMSDSYLVIDENYKIIDYNKTFTDKFKGVFEVKRKDNLIDLLKKYPSQIIENQMLIKYNNEAMKDRKTVYLENHIQYQEFDKHFKIEIIPIFSNNQYIGTIILLKDITDHKKNIETIRRNQEILMEQERLASLGQMIGGIAHNLKTPIMSIAGGLEAFNDLIKEYDESIDDSDVTKEDHHDIAREMKEWVGKLKPHLSYMSEIITAVKDQAVHLNASTFNGFTINELVKRVDILMKHELKKNYCKLNMDVKANENLEVSGEVSSLIQIFDNLIINAIYAYEGNGGEIDFIIEKKDEDVLFTIRDQAKGIPKEVQKKLFKQMYTTKGKNGTGLGLYMSYSTIKGRFGGNMWFESEEGKGTTFFVSIPIKK